MLFLLRLCECTLILAKEKKKTKTHKENILSSLVQAETVISRLSHLRNKIKTSYRQAFIYAH